VADPVLHVLFPPREHVVQHNHFVALHHQPVHQVGAHKPRAPRHQDPLAVALGQGRHGGPELPAFRRLVLNRRHFFQELGAHLSGNGFVEVDTPTPCTFNVLRSVAAEAACSEKHEKPRQGQQAHEALGKGKKEAQA
jgi:hypothetical protein